MELSADRLAYIYSMIGPAGVALVFVALFAVYLAVWQLIYMTAVWRNFRRDFLDLERGNERCLRFVDPNKANPLIRMVDVFQSMSDVTHANAQILASGIWSALITTIMGLSVAIPTLMCYYYLMLKFRGFHIEAIEHSYRALEVMRKIRAKRAKGADENSGL